MKESKRAAYRLLKRSRDQEADQTGESMYSFNSRMTTKAMRHKDEDKE